MKLWANKTEKQRADIFTKLNYSFPDILAKRIWSKLPKQVREEFKTFIKEN